MKRVCEQAFGCEGVGCHSFFFRFPDHRAPPPFGGTPMARKVPGSARLRNGCYPMDPTAIRTDTGCRARALSARTKRHAASRCSSLGNEEPRPPNLYRGV